jgi:hypothetical protein
VKYWMILVHPYISSRWRFVPPNQDCSRPNRSRSLHAICSRSHPNRFHCGIAEDTVYEVHRGLQVTLGVEIRFLCLPQDGRLQERQQHA